jgi:enoyl-CoA hydratase
MNAIDPETHEALIAAWTRFRDDDGAWVAILTGAGEKSFSAGAGAGRGPQGVRGEAEAKLPGAAAWIWPN